MFSQAYRWYRIISYKFIATYAIMYRIYCCMLPSFYHYYDENWKRQKVSKWVGECWEWIVYGMPWRAKNCFAYREAHTHTCARTYNDDLFTVWLCSHCVCVWRVLCYKLYGRLKNEEISLWFCSFSFRELLSFSIASSASSLSSPNSWLFPFSIHFDSIGREILFLFSICSHHYYDYDYIIMHEDRITHKVSRTKLISFWHEFE